MSLVTREQFVNSPKPVIVKGATVYGVKLPLKVKDSIVQTPHNLRIIGQRMKINEFLDTREINDLGIQEPAKEIPVYSVKIDGQVRPLLFQMAMVQHRAIISQDSKTIKLPAKVEPTAFNESVLDIVYTLGLNCFNNVADNMLPVHYAVMHGMMLSEEFLEIRNKTSLEYESFTTFDALPSHLMDVYSLFAYRAVELIHRANNRLDAATNANQMMQKYAQARSLDLNSFLDIVHEKLEKLAAIQERFGLRDALENLGTLSAIPKMTGNVKPELPEEVLTNQVSYPNQELIAKYLQDKENIQASWSNVTNITLWHQWLTGLNEFPSPEVDAYLPDNWRDADNKLELMQQALIAYLDELTTGDTEQPATEPQLNTELIQNTTEQTVNECKNHTVLDSLINQLTGIEKFDKAGMIHEFLSDSDKQDIGAVNLKQRKAAMIAWLNSIKTTEQPEA